MPPEVVGWRKVIEETDPLADKTHRALDLCCANASNFAATSCQEEQLIIFLHHEKVEYSVN